MGHFIRVVVALVIAGATAMLAGIWVGYVEDRAARFERAVLVLERKNLALHVRIVDLKAAFEETDRELEAYKEKVNNLSIGYINHHGMYPWKKGE